MFERLSHVEKRIKQRGGTRDKTDSTEVEMELMRLNGGKHLFFPQRIGSA